MKKNIRLFIAFIAVCGLIGGGIGYYMFQKTHDNLSDLSADYSLAASELFNEYEVDESKANGLYLDKVLEISGTLAEKSEVGEGEIVLFIRPDDAIFGVSCAFSGADAKTAKALKEGAKLSVKGICTGMNMDVNLVRCVINE
ncbi:MAG: hypothetical protein AB8H47_06470 [Bacteroidia bacterium]